MNGDQGKPFFASLEINNNICFGSEKGKVWLYSKDSEAFYEIRLETISRIREISALNDNRLVISTMTEGFFVYNLQTEQATQYSTTNLPLLKSNKIDLIFPYNKNQIWFTNDEVGVYKLDLTTKELKHFEVSVDDNSVYSFSPDPIFLTDKNSNLWIHPKGGGFSFYNIEKDKLEPFYNKANDPNRKFSNILHSALFDRQGILWFCTRSHGLEKAIFNPNEYTSKKLVDESLSSLSNNVRSLCQLNNGNILVSTKEGRLLLCDRNLQVIGCININGQIVKNYLWPSSIYYITQDSKNTIWLGTRGDGIYTLLPNKEFTSYTVQNYKHSDSNPFSLSNNNIYSILEDDNNVWVATLGGGLNLIQDISAGNYRFINSNNKLNNFPIGSCSRIRCIKKGPNNKIYAGTSNGLLVWDSKITTPETLEFNHFVRADQDNNGLSNNEIMDIGVVNVSDIYLATYGGGLNKVNIGTTGNITGFKYYLKENGLPSEVILSLQPDHMGNLWLATENDLVRFNTNSESFETYPEVKLLLSSNIFSETTTLQLQNERILFGYLDGIISFYPEQIISNNFIPNIVLSNFQLFNKPIENFKNAPFTGSVNEVDHIELLHNQNFFNFEFSSLDFYNTNQILYAYKLEGFDEDWNYTKKQRFANYTNIPKGNYVFRVKSTNGNGVWVNNERKLSIIIKPSFWETPFAYGLYFIIIIGIFLLIQKNILVIYKLKHDVKLQKDLADLKLKFFTDISHEIRTPLTLITGPVENVLNDDKTPLNIKKQLKFVSQSTNRLLKLVNQILDFRKIQDQHLKITEVDLGLVTKELCASFQRKAEEKGIHFNFKKIVNDTIIWFDKDSLEKILMNLLSNAFKYCADGNEVRVEVIKNDKNSILKVIDDGPGIAKSKQKDLFERFSTYNSDINKPSTGIGLSIVKEIADKHSAIVSVDSDIGKGCCFVVNFKNGFSHFDKGSEIVFDEQKNVGQEEIDKDSHNDIHELSDRSETDNRLSILLVEDDVELLNFMKSTLEEDYLVHEAKDGEEGLKMAVSLNPDLVISDIMMPNKDGVSLLRDIRDNIETSHIPVILLTAKSNIESKLQGLSYGADDYITKPFNVAYLKARIINLIKQRERLHDIYSSDISNKPHKKIPNTGLISAIDEQFMEKVIECIYSNMDKSDFTVEDLGKMMSLSKSTFFNKIKSLSGVSPVEFIRDIRIKHAAQLIRNEKLLIKEICYMIGFSDIKYFGKCFKTKYGMTPVEYRNKK